MAEDLPHITVSYSDIEGGVPDDVTDGGENLDTDPLFVNPGAGDYRLQNTSPCVDEGTNTNIPIDTFDIDGDANTSEATPELQLFRRIIEGDGISPATVDMGAFETCPYDCQETPNGEVGINDLLDLLSQWGEAGSCDVDGNGSVGIADLLGLLANWGSCGSPSGPGVPTTVSECIYRYGYDAQRLAACICIVEPCTEGCPPEGCQ